MLKPGELIVGADDRSVFVVAVTLRTDNATLAIARCLRDGRSSLSPVGRSCVWFKVGTQDWCLGA
jgi:hypothetical protein